MKNLRSQKSGFTPLESTAYSVERIADRKKLNAKRYPLTAKKGFTLLELMVAVAIIGILVTLAVPNFINARRRAKASTCVNNLKLLYEAGQLMRLEHGSGIYWLWPEVINTYGYTERVLSCPIGGNYAAWNIETHPVCSVGTNGTAYDWDDHIYP